MSGKIYQCYLCQDVLFEEDMSRSGGSFTYCKKCHATRMRRWRMFHRESYLASLRKSYHTNKDKIDKYKASERFSNPELHRARNTARYHLKEKQPCEVCGSLDTHRHHEDYSKPLEVRWLCQLHHKEVHNES